MTEKTNVELLKMIEQKLRSRENDRDYLAHQLMVLAGVIAHEKQNESGLVCGALGGISYAVNRLREIWKDDEAPSPKSLAELEEIYAGVELMRFARTEKDLEATREKYRKENLFINIHKLEFEGLEPVYVFSSRINQTTIDGAKVQQSEILDAACAPVASFQTVFRELNNPNKKR